MLTLPIEIQAREPHTIRRREAVIEVRDVTVAFGEKTVLEGLDLDIYRGEILAFIGPSGTGKSVLMRTILGLNPKRSGEIRIFGGNFLTAEPAQRAAIEMRMGVLFQQGALFSALTVRENIQVPMREYLRLPQRLMDELAELKIAMVGLAADAADKYPSRMCTSMAAASSRASRLRSRTAMDRASEGTAWRRGFRPLSNRKPAGRGRA